ncbi:hypothetical protein CRG49_000685 [Neisseria sp. N95_16]|uniref:Uncharacterized protein n=1 Tax=Neisseria brasiliensis TaxID=2666100 RepID=A0A7X2H0S2_9NEIS|nr:MULTISPECIES: hypothetical protein [Neisseria]MRN38592.1 hypothetical protein [Neisseria brasiliensis]PJO10767.1 hypothetical protein CRG49_000685 [Neisseria sp. N95_16]
MIKFISTRRAVSLVKGTKHCPFKRLGLTVPNQNDYLAELNNYRLYNPAFKRLWNQALNWAKKEAGERDTFAVFYKSSPKSVQDLYPFTATIKDAEQRRKFYVAVREYHAYGRLPFGFGKGNIEISL